MSTQLPCFPCPHKALCCSFGTDLSHEEATAIIKRWGPDKVVVSMIPGEEAGGKRTNVIPGWGCVFLKTDHSCAIHAEPEYPRVCAGFPDSDGEGGPCTTDPIICPELYQVKR